MLDKLSPFQGEYPEGGMGFFGQAGGMHSHS